METFILPKGSFTGYKGCGNYVVELLIPKEAFRLSTSAYKCRCNKAKVVSITEICGNNSNLLQVKSDADSNFIYEIGKTIEVKEFDANKYNKWSTGIHFFLNRSSAVQWIQYSNNKRRLYNLFALFLFSFLFLYYIFNIVISFIFVDKK